MWKNRLRRYEILSGEEVEVIHDHAMTILEEIGIDFLHETARDTFRRAGMTVEDDRVRLDRELVREMVAKAPSQFHRRGAKRADQVAAERWKQMLAEYPDPGIEPGLDEQLREFVARRKEEIVRVGAEVRPAC